MMLRPYISVIMSVYNTKEEWLRLSIESILTQTYENFEFIIVLDAPTDNSEKIVEEYQNIDDRIIVIKNESNLGITKSLNKGLSIAKGDYIARMDSDDISVESRFEKQLNFMELNKKISAVGSYIANFGTGKITIGSYQWRKRTEEEKVRLLFGNAGIPHPTAFIRKSFLTDNNIRYNEKYEKSQDFGLWVDITKNGGYIYQLDKVLLLYRVSSTQISNANKSDQTKFHDMIIKDQLCDLFNPTVDEYRMHLDLIHHTCRYSCENYIDYINKLIKINNEKKIYDSEIFKKELKYIRMKYLISDEVDNLKKQSLITIYTIKLSFDYYTIFHVINDFYKHLKYKIVVTMFYIGNKRLFDY